MFNKKNTFTDFIACADALIADKYTSKDRLVIEGGSAGGLLMGAVTNMRPDLFHAVIARVPFVDVINTMLDESLPLTVGEFEEWGNPKIPEQYAYMKSYSPYDNLEAKAYPAILVKTSFDDSQVMYWEPAKYVAKLRTLKTDPNPLIFKINMAGGHGGSSGRYDRLHELAFDYAFEPTQMGIGNSLLPLESGFQGPLCPARAGAGGRALPYGDALTPSKPLPATSSATWRSPSRTAGPRSSRTSLQPGARLYDTTSRRFLPATGDAALCLIARPPRSLRPALFSKMSRRSSRPRRWRRPRRAPGGASCPSANRLPRSRRQPSDSARRHRPSRTS